MRLTGAAFILCLLPALAGASEPLAAAPPARKPERRAPAKDGPDVSGGFSYLRSGDASLLGGHVSVSAQSFHRSFRLVADLSVHTGSFAGADLSQVTFLVGARHVWHGGRRLRPFGQLLVGGARTKSEFADAGLSSSATGWGGAPGAGVDYVLSPRWAVRGQGDVLLLHSAGGWDADPRLSVGVVYRFGR